MHLALVLKIVPRVGEFHAVVLQEAFDLEAGFDAEQTANFGLGELTLPVRFQDQGLYGLARQLCRISAKPLGKFFGNFDRDDHIRTEKPNTF
jgi:hypothetical protein